MTRFKPYLVTLFFLPALCRAADCTESLKPNTPIEAVGIYSSSFGNDSKQAMNYWYSTTLWHSGDCYFGFFNATTSHEGDPPYGVLNFRYVPPDAKIAFSSKLSEGSRIQVADQPGIPTRDFFEFSGTFSRKKIAGTFTYTDKLGDNASTSQSATLRLDKNSAQQMYLSRKGTTYADWLADANDTLKQKGPKW